MATGDCCRRPSWTVPSGGGNTTINEQDPQTSATTGTGSNQTVYTYTATSPGAGSCYKLSTAISSGGSGTLNILISFGGTTDTLFSVAAGFTTLVSVDICNKSGVQNAQWYTVDGGGAGIGGGSVVFGTFSQNWTSSQAIAILANVAATGTWQGQGWVVRQ